MSKFLELVESNNPQGSDKWDLVDYLKSKGIKVSSVKNTDMLYIDTGEKTVAITVSNTDEDLEIAMGSKKPYDVEDAVEGLSDKASSGVKGLMARGVGTAAQRAKSAVKKRDKLAGQAVDVYDRTTKDLESAIRLAKRTPASVNINSR